MDFEKIKILVGIFIMALPGVFLGSRVGDAWYAPGFLVGGLLAIAVLSRLLRPDVRAAAIIVFSILTLAALVGTVAEQFERTGWIAIPVDLAIALAVGASIWYWLGGRRWLAGRRALLRACAAHGFVRRSLDGALLRRVRMLHPWLPNRFALYGAADGTVDGTELTMLGYRGMQIWLARLPFALPQVVIRRPREFVSWDEHRPPDEHRSLANALLTPTVMELAASAGIVDCRIERDDLMIRFVVDSFSSKNPSESQVGAAFARHASTAAAIARALPLANARDHAVDPEGLPDPTLAVREERLGFVRLQGILAALILPLPALCLLGLGWSQVGSDTMSTVIRAILVSVGGAGIAVALVGGAAAMFVLPILRRRFRPAPGLRIVRTTGTWTWTSTESR